MSSISLKQVYPPAPITERGKATHLYGDAKNKQLMTYATGDLVVVRNVNDPTDSFLYSGHVGKVLLASMSPSGAYIASSDNEGHTFVWSWTNPEHVTVLDRGTVPLPTDIAWSDDSKRIAVVGSGSQQYGHAFFADTGAAVGAISGHSGTVLTCDIRKERPFRLVTGGEDRKVNVFPGPPFNYESTKTNHKNYVNCVRYSPNGQILVSVGSDKQVVTYDGKETEVLNSSTSGHTGTIYSVSWNDSSDRFLTVGADKTARIWDANSLDVLQTFQFPNNVNNFQVGALWQGDNLITLNLRGDLTYLDETNPEQPLRVLHGHQKRIHSLTYDASSGHVYTSDTSGYVIQWQEGTAETRVFEQNIMAGEKSVIASKYYNGHVYLVAYETLAVGSTDSFETVTEVSFEGRPVGLDVHGDDCLIPTEQGELLFFQGFQSAGKHTLGFQPTCIAIHPDGVLVAIGGKDNHVRVYNRNGNSVTLAYELRKHIGSIASLAWSNDGRYLASGAADRYIYGWEGENNVFKKWVFHNSTVNTLSWSPNSLFLASGGADRCIFVWSVQKQTQKLKVQPAHKGAVTGIAWVNDDTIISSGEDGAVCSWTVTVV